MYFSDFYKFLQKRNKKGLKGPLGAQRLKANVRGTALSTEHQISHLTALVFVIVLERALALALNIVLLLSLLLLSLSSLLWCMILLLLMIVIS